MRHQFTTSDGTPLTYLDYGIRDGNPVVLCHGLGAGAAQFAADAQWFAEQGYRVLVPDLRGHGGSGAPARGDAKDYAVERLARDQIELLDHVQVDRAHWVGNSLGGIIGLSLVAAAPERVLSLATFGTALALNLPEWAAGMMPLLDRVPGRGPMARLTAWSTTRNPAARPVIEAMLLRYDAVAVASIMRHVCRYDLTSAAESWSGPAMVLVGGRDTAVNRALRGHLDLLRVRPNWTIAELAEGGHCANLDVPDDWRRALLDFWVHGRLAGQ